MLERLRNLSSEASWQLKQLWRRSPSPRLPNCCDQRSRLVAGFNTSQAHRYGELISRYEIADFCSVLSPEQWRENLYVLDVLDQHLSDLPIAMAGLEIGCRNFSYLPALHGFRAIPWLGVELDAYARYWNGITRSAYGQVLANRFPNCRYHSGSLYEVTGGYDIIVWFLPFVFVDTVSSYGLPRRFFDPQRLLIKAYELLKPEGTLFIVNQGMDEYVEQQRLCIGAGISCAKIGEIVSVLTPFQKTRYFIRVQK